MHASNVREWSVVLAWANAIALIWAMLLGYIPANLGTGLAFVFFIMLAVWSTVMTSEGPRVSGPVIREIKDK